MFAEYSSSELLSIFAMQGVAGLILFSVFVLMALGLAIIFGQWVSSIWRTENL
jgi:urea transport system permease protein